MIDDEVIGSRIRRLVHDATRPVTIDEIANPGPENAGDRRRRRGRSPVLIGVAIAVVVALVTVGVITARRDSTSRHVGTVDAAASGPASWKAFCRVARTIKNTKLHETSPHSSGNPNLPQLHRELIAAAPAGRFRDAVRRADARLQSPISSGDPPKLLADLRAVNTGLVDHCGLSTLMFGIGVRSARTEPDVSTRITLPSEVIVSGTTVNAELVVNNTTRAPIDGTACGSPFALVLSNDSVQQQGVFLQCRMPFVVPVGKSRYPVTIYATYLQCGQAGPGPVCADGRPLPLPPGTYQLTLVQSSPFVSAPKPITVHVKHR